MADDSARDAAAEIVADTIASNKGRHSGIPPARLARFIEAQPGVEGPVAIGDCSVPTGNGSSAGIVMFDAEIGAARIPLVVRYATGETGFFSHYDMEQQFRVMAAVKESAVKLPRVRWLDADGSLLGYPGYAMDRIDAPAPSGLAFSVGPLAEATPDGRRAMVFGAMEQLAILHRLRPEALDIDFLHERGSGDDPIARDLDWTWRQISWACPDRLAELRPGMDRLMARRPADAEIVLCHGDPNLGNFMYADGDVAALLDWELAQLNAPETDVEWLIYTMKSFRIGDYDDTGIPTDGELRAHYEKTSGRKLRNMEYFRTVVVNRTLSWILMGMRGRKNDAASQAFLQPYFDDLQSALREI
ncbi:MAG: phosphotransferase family protein [Parasphingopyxis sp.]|uniref:phosphotransferase family protein n=1 Tax=Parasphingopyxis sp. TaxID=1920299 RepID=UPI003F9F208D